MTTINFYIDLRHCFDETDGLHLVGNLTLIKFYEFGKVWVKINWPD